MQTKVQIEKAETELSKLHPDFQELRVSEDFHEWVAAQPKWIQSALYENDTDHFTDFERLEAKLEKHAGNLSRAAVELAKDWRSDKYLRRLEALMAVADKEKSFIISGTGDVLEPEDGIIGIGSGGNYALAAAKVLAETDMSAEDIARKSIKVASDICVFTNNNVTVEKI